MRIYSYDRTSVWDANKVSNEAQREQNRQRAVSKHNKEPLNFCDYGQTGSNTSREGFKALCNHIRSSDERGYLYVYRYDRISRIVIGAIVFLKLCFDHNIEVCSISEPLPEGMNQSFSVQKLFVQSLFILAEMQRETTIENIRSGLSYKRSQGKYLSSVVPFGYRLVQGNVIQHENESIIVRRIFDLYNTGAYGYKRLISQLNNEKITWRGRPFKEHNITSILKNPLYYGRVKGGTFGTYKGDFQPIISQATYDCAAKIRASRTVEKIDDRIYPLRKKVICPYCNRKLSPKRLNNNTSSYAYYHCANRTCKGMLVVAEKLEEEVSALLSLFFQSKGLYQDLVTELESLIFEIEQQDKRQLKRSNENKQTLIEDYEKGQISLEELKERMKPFKADLKQDSLIVRKGEYHHQLKELLSLKDKSIQQLIFEQVSHVELNRNKEIIGVYLLGIPENIIKKAS